MKRNFLFAMALLLLFAPPPARAQVSFSNPTSYPVGTAPVAVAIGDFNADGKLDLAVANSGVFRASNGGVSILLGNGDGTFLRANNIALGSNAQSILAGDFDQDDNLDLVVVSPGEQDNNVPSRGVIMLGNGDGTFRAAIDLNVNSFAVAAAAGDVNRDGKLDLLVVNSGDLGSGSSNANVSVLRGDGNGTFQAAVNYPVGSVSISSSPIAVADFTGNGKLDLAIGGNGVISVLRGNGDGTFQAAVNYTVSTSIATHSVVAADFNGDGKLDLASRSISLVSNHDVLGVQIGNGDGSFGPVVRQVTGLSGSLCQMAVGDFDNDDKLDLGLADGGVGILLGHGDGTFSSPVSFGAGAGGCSVAVGDFNQDELPDIVVANSEGNTVSVLLNNIVPGNFTLADAGNGSGIVTSSPAGINCGSACSKSLAPGTMVTLTANSASGSSFAGWSGAGCSGTGICSVTMNANESVTATFSLVVAPSFSISAASGVNISSPGQPGSTTATVSPNGGFTGTVMLSCTTDAGANESGCSFTVGSTSGSTVQVNLNGSSVDVTFNVTTMGPHTVAALHTGPFGAPGGLAASAMLIFLIPIAYRRRRALLGFAVLAFLLILAACGGGGGGGGHTDPGTASGNYTFTVTGTSGSGSSAATVSAPITVTVQ